jgi:hypothetical protein
MKAWKKVKHWSEKEKKKYVNFLAKKKHFFELSLSSRKAKGIHVKMSKVIISRTSSQCRSHHQKLIAKYGTVENIIFHFRDLLTGKIRQILQLPQSK